MQGAIRVSRICQELFLFGSMYMSSIPHSARLSFEGGTSEKQRVKSFSIERKEWPKVAESTESWSGYN